LLPFSSLIKNHLWCLMLTTPYHQLNPSKT
jgi:hypothetical protein